MAVLVTGATGKLGQVLVHRLVAEGRDVRVLTRRPFRAADLFSADVAIHEWHPLSEPVPPEALTGVASIVHLMGAPFAGGRSRDRADLAIGSRVTTMQCLVEAIKGTGIRLVAASLALGGEGEGGEVPLTEADLSPPHAEGGMPWEALLAVTEAEDANFAVVRFGLLAAPGAAVTSLVRMARVGIVVDLEGRFIPAIDPADAAALLSGLIDRRDMTGLFLGVAPVPVRGEAVASALAEASFLPFSSRPLMLPALLTRRLLSRRVGLIAGLLTCGRPVRSLRLAEAGAQFTTPDPTDLLRRAIADTIAGSSGLRLRRAAMRKPPSMPAGNGALREVPAAEDKAPDRGSEAPNAPLPPDGPVGDTLTR